MAPAGDILGIGLSIVGVGFPAGIALLKFIPSRNNGVCSQHSGFVSDIKNIHEDLRDIKKDVRTLLSRRRVDTD